MGSEKWEGRSEKWEMKDENNNYQHYKGYVGQGLVEISGLKISLWISSCVYTYHMSEKLNEIKLQLA